MEWLFAVIFLHVSFIFAAETENMIELIERCLDKDSKWYLGFVTVCLWTD